jgi:putative DNA primase/helicase
MRAEGIAKALGGRRVSCGWMARGPVHEDRTPSLSIEDAEGRKVLVYCHAGCDQAAVIDALRAQGLWQGNGRHSRDTRREMRRANHLTDRDDDARTGAALRIWRATRPAPGTLVDIYLSSRGIRIALPPTIRFHAGLKHPWGGTWPAMVALVTRGIDDGPLAVHRTFLTPDGSGKAPVEPQRMMLGPCRGGAVRLAPIGDVLMVGEGIETCLAAMQATGKPAWAALSTSGLCALDLPDAVREVIVLADGDEPGEVAARQAARRWSREGRRVRIARPPWGFDFNDLLMRRVPHQECAA